MSKKATEFQKKEMSNAELQLGSIENREYDQQRGIFRLMKPFFRRNTLCIARENGAQQAEKTRCLGMLTVFR